jgi:hypothetical protein
MGLQAGSQTNEKFAAMVAVLFGPPVSVKLAGRGQGVAASASSSVVAHTRERCESSLKFCGLHPIPSYEFKLDLELVRIRPTVH